MDDVDGRLERPQRDDRRGLDVLERSCALGAGVRPPDCVTRAANQRAGRSAGQQEPSDHEREDADDRRPRLADEHPEDSLQPAPDRATVIRAQRGEQAEARHRQTGAEGVHVDERAARHHQGADDGERDGCDVRGCSDRRREAVGDPAADHASAPPEVQDRRQKDAQRDEPEPNQLGVLLALRLPLAPLRADARGQARLERALLSASRHARCFAVETSAPTRKLRFRSG